MSKSPLSKKLTTSSISFPPQLYEVDLDIDDIGQMVSCEYEHHLVRRTESQEGQSGKRDAYQLNQTSVCCRLSRKREKPIQCTLPIIAALPCNVFHTARGHSPVSKLSAPALLDMSL